jgi:acid phosphatase (class A)
MSIRLPRLLLSACLLLATAGFVGAKDKTAKLDKAEVLHFVAPGSVDVMKLLPAPPKPETEEARADLEVVLRVQEKRSDVEVERALSEAKLKMGAFTTVIGPWFTAENLPLTAKLIKAAEKDSKYFSSLGKEKFARKRPPNDARIKPKIEESDEPSYPSGHSTRGVLFASIIAELSPERRDALMDRAREIGWDRVIAGVHYPSDIIAGRVLGQALFQAMSRNSEFQSDLAEARAEFTAAQIKFSGK